MTARDPLGTLAPEFAIRVNDQPLPNEAMADLVQVSVLDDVDAPGMFALTLTAWDTQKMQPKWVDAPLFAVGNPLSIALGYRNTTAVLIDGEITGLEADFPVTRAPMVVVRGYDRRHRLMRSRKTRSFTNAKDSDIASQVASDAGLTPQVEDTGVMLPYVLQHGQTDLEFLCTRARRIHFEVVVEARNLLYRPRKTDGPEALVLQREINLMEFRPRLSTIGQVPSLEVRGWDPSQKKEIVGQAGSSDAGRAMGGQAAGPDATQQAFNVAATARVTMPVQGQDEADAIARHGFAEMALGYIHADGVCIGEPALKAGVVVKVDGVGERFGGPYYVTAVEHSFAPGKGYRTSFHARRNAS